MSTLADNVGSRPRRAVRVDQVHLAVCLVLLLALLTLATRVHLGADTNTLADLDECDFGANTNSTTDDF